LCASVSILCCLIGAAAAPADVLVLGRDGHVRPHRDLTGPASDLPAPGRAVRPLTATAARARTRTVIGELKRLRAAGAIATEQYASLRATYEGARSMARKLSGIRAAELGAVVRTADAIARKGQLTRSRLAPLFLTLQRNREWWAKAPLPAAGQRVGFDGSELVFQYYPGQGIQLQALANFGKVNALWTGGKRYDARLGALVDELVPLAAERAGGLAWEYYFTFDGGSPPWVSSLAEGTAVQGLARAAVRLGRQADLLPVAQRALAPFEARPPAGVAVRTDRGTHYAQYSFAPGLRILNGFVQSVVGLHDYAELSGDARAQQLYAGGEREARHEVPQFDTGAWSLYERGTSKRESDLGYHTLLRDFLRSLCRRADEPAVYCDAATHFTAYLEQAPELTLRTSRLRGGRWGTLRFKLSKVSAVSVRVARGDELVLSRPLGRLGYGTRSTSFAVPRRSGEYTVQLSATDLAGNAATETGTVRVSKPPKPNEHGR
jgi:hypothetical protein